MKYIIITLIIAIPIVSIVVSSAKEEQPETWCADTECETEMLYRNDVQYQLSNNL